MAIAADAKKKSEVVPPLKAAPKVNAGLSGIAGSFKTPLQGLGYSQGKEALSPSNAPHVPQTAKAKTPAKPETTACPQTQPMLPEAFLSMPTKKPADPVEAEFAMLKREGHGEAYSFLKTFWDNPKAVGRIFAEEFVKSDLKPFIKPFEVGSTILGMSPDPKNQAMSTGLSVIAESMNAFVGLVKGDHEKVAEAAVGLTVDVFVKDPFKGTDGRVRGASKAALKKYAANISNKLVKDKIKDFADGLVETLYGNDTPVFGGGKSRGHGGGGSW